MTGYLIFGILWTMWLEFYTTNYLTGEYSKQWVWRERIFHTVLWPVSLGIFIYNLLFP